MDNDNDKDNDNDNDNEKERNDIHIMKNIKLMMDKDICQPSHNQEYKQIYKLTYEYLQKHCKHNIIKDYIDTFPERSEAIYYCSHCYLMKNEIEIDIEK
jgi:hypothetical protein